MTAAWTESEIIQAVAGWLPWWRYLVVPKVILCGGEGEMDIAAVSRKGLLYEIEVKSSRADWLADKKKSKWKRLQRYGTPPYPASRFSYAIPVELIRDGIPDFVTPCAGILILSRVQWCGGLKPHITTYRLPTLLHLTPLSGEAVFELAQKATQRYWRSKQ